MAEENELQLALKGKAATAYVAAPVRVAKESITHDE
jgi:hypothetical protein